MPEAKQISVTTAHNATHFAQSRVESAELAEEDAEIEAAPQNDADLESWLQNVGGPIYDSMKADPSRGISADEVLRRIEARSHARQAIA